MPAAPARFHQHSVVRGSSAAARRAIADASAVTDAPSSNSDGYELRYGDVGAVTLKVAGTSAEAGLRVWGYSPVSEQWAVLSTLASGVGTVAAPVGLLGCSRVALELYSVGGSSVAINAWIAEVAL